MPAGAPVNEIGYAQAPNYNWWLYDEETTPELIWPQSVAVYEAMRTQDAQVASVLRAVTLPVRRTPWRIDPAGTRPEVAQFVADDLGLPIVGRNPSPPPRTRDRFSWPEHLRQALLMLPFGHMYFEIVFRVSEDGARAHLRKLAPRMPKTIERIEVADDGGLISIRQWWTRTDAQPKPIPVDRLVAYVHDREGGNWLGRSLLRPAYKHWLIKDRLLRVQAQTIERNGMGVPLYKGQEDASAEDLAAGKAMATAWRAGEAAGSAVPHGADLILRGVEGDLPDADPAIRYHDEQIARAVLAHFLNLGTQTGSWALGTTFADFFTLSLQTLAHQIADTATQHIVEDIVDANFGEEEPAPRLVFDEIGSRQAATAQALKALVDAGVIHPDQVLEESSRQQYGLPPQDPATTTTPPPGDGGGDGAPKAVAAAAAHDTDDEVDDGGCDDADIDDGTLALITAMVELDGIRAAFDPAKHPRIPKGQPGAGRFLSMVERVKVKVREHLDGNGNGDPFEGFNREQLRKAAKARGIGLQRGASRDDIAEALLADLGAHVKAPPSTPAPKRVTVPTKAKPYHPAIDDVADLARAVEKGRIIEDRELAGGAIGAVHLRTYQDGTRVVYKRMVKAGTSDKSFADSEQLGALLARQLGLAAPRVYRTGVDELHMEYMADAVIAEDHHEIVRRSVHSSHEGYMLGLLDVLTDQADRHDGNWMITDSGHLVPIDNGGWWPEYDDPYYTPQDAPSLRSPFSAKLISEYTDPLSATGKWIDNDFSRADIAAIRKRLSSLEPQFEHLGRKEWFDYMMARLDEVEKHATGTTSRLLPVR